MSGTGKTLKERLDWLEKNDPIYKKEKQAVIETIEELRLNQKVVQKIDINSALKNH